MINLSVATIFVPLIVAFPLLVSLVSILISKKNISFSLATVTALFTSLMSVYILLHFNSSVNSLNSFILDLDVNHVTNGIQYNMGGFLPPVGIQLKADFLSVFFLVITNIIAFIAMTSSKKMVENDIDVEKQRHFYPLFLLLLAGNNGIILTNDLFNMFVFLEIASLSTYVLISMNKHKQGALFAYNYLIIGTVAASLFVMGVGIFYSYFGVLSIDGIQELLMSGETPIYPTLILGYIIISIAIITKIALYPMFWYLPNTYKAAPNALNLYMSAVSSKVSIYMFIKVVIFAIGPYIGEATNQVLDVILILAAISLIMGALISIRQNDMKKLLAFSSLSQVGFIMIGLTILSVESIIASLLTVLAHSFTKIGLFMAAGLFMYKYGTTNLTKLSGTFIHDRLVFTCIIFLALSLIGIPGTFGFYGKVNMLSAILNSAFWPLIILVALSSACSFFYGWRLIGSLWENKVQVEPLHKTPTIIRVALVSLVLINILFTIYSGNIVVFLEYLVNISIIG